MGFYLKHPQSRVAYSIDWAPAFLGGEAIDASLWSIEPEEAGGIEVEDPQVAGGRATAVLRGGRDGHVYSIANRVTLTDGRSDVRAITVRAEAR